MNQKNSSSLKGRGKSRIASHHFDFDNIEIEDRNNPVMIRNSSNERDGLERTTETATKKSHSVPRWPVLIMCCAISFFLGRISACVPNITSPYSNFVTHINPIPRQYPSSQCDTMLRWKLNMRQARAYGGITVPLNNGFAAKCIPDITMSQMGADFVSSKLSRTSRGLSDGMLHQDENILSDKQVGTYASQHMKLSKDSRPIWTAAVWNSFLIELNEGRDGGPPVYTNSGKSVVNAVTWVLENILKKCGMKNEETCHLAVFSAISPWAEVIMYWSASKLSRNIRITSVDFNPCILKDDMPEDSVSECLSTRDLVERNGPSQDLIVSYSGIEHDGLGRYGDPINPTGDISAAREMWLLSNPGGVLLVSSSMVSILFLYVMCYAHNIESQSFTWIFKLAVPRAGQQRQPRSYIPIWGNKKIHVLQHRDYGAERYMRLLIGWELEGFVLYGNDVVERRHHESKLYTLSRMLQCSYEIGERQPLLILRKSENMSFDDIMLEDENWNAKQVEREYHSITSGVQNTSCI